jgi:MFS family permease
MAFTGFGVVIATIAACRILQGVAVGVFNTSSQTYVADAAPPARRAETLGYVNTFQTMASSIGPTIAFALLTWPAAQWLNSVATWWPGLDEGPLAEYSFAAFFIVCLAIALAGAALLTTIRDTERARVSRGFSWATLAEPKAILPMLLTVLSIVPFGGLLAFMSFFAPERGLENVGLFFTVQSLGVFLSGLTMGRVADRFGRYPVVVSGMFLSAFGMFLVALAPNAAVLLFAGFFSGFVQGGSRNAMAALTADRVPQARRGAALSTYAMGFDIGVGIGTPLLGYIAATRDVGSAFIASGLIVLVGSILAAVFLRGGAASPD